MSMDNAVCPLCGSPDLEGVKFDPGKWEHDFIRGSKRVPSGEQVTAIRCKICGRITATSPSIEAEKRESLKKQMELLTRLMKGSKGGGE